MFALAPCTSSPPSLFPCYNVVGWRRGRCWAGCGIEANKYGNAKLDGWCLQCNLCNLGMCNAGLSKGVPPSFLFGIWEGIRLRKINRKKSPTNFKKMSRQSLQAIGEASFAQSERVSTELFTLTYGTFVRQLLNDYESAEGVNEELESMGYKMGIRIIDDFLAKSEMTGCKSFAETAEVIAKVGFKMFLNVSTASVKKWSGDGKECSIVFTDNPLAEFAELQAGEECSGLWYSNAVCGVIRGCLEMIGMKVTCHFVQCRLRGDDVNEIRVCLHEILVEQVMLDSLILLYNCNCTYAPTYAPTYALRRPLPNR